MAIQHDSTPRIDTSPEPSASNAELNNLSTPSDERFQVAGRLFSRRGRAAPETAPAEAAPAEAAPAAQPQTPQIGVPVRPADTASVEEKRAFQQHLLDTAKGSEQARELLGAGLQQYPEVRAIFKITDSDIASSIGPDGKLDYKALGDKALARFGVDGDLGQQTDALEAVLTKVSQMPPPSAAPATPQEGIAVDPSGAPEAVSREGGGRVGRFIGRVVEGGGRVIGGGIGGFVRGVGSAIEETAKDK